MSIHGNSRSREIGSSVEFIRGMHESSIHALIEGALLACLVVFLILRDWRATLIARRRHPALDHPDFRGDRSYLASRSTW